MPQRKNIKGDLGTTKIASDSYDIDNVYFTQEGWVYRHYKKADKSKWWDEIIVAGEVVLPTAKGGPDDGSGDDNDEVIATNPAKLGLAGTNDASGNSVAAPEFEGGGDGYSDYQYSPLYGIEAVGGGVPNMDSTGDGDGDTSEEGAAVSLGFVAAGSGYSAGVTYPTTSDGDGAGLTVKVTESPIINSASVQIIVRGSGYIAGETVTLTGGDDNAQFTVNDAF